MPRSLVLLLFYLFAPRPCFSDDGSPNSTEFVSGWVSSPDGRGTFDIIQSCLFTIFLCTWSALHLNLPAKNERHLYHILRKVKWMIQTLLGPEFIVWLAVGQRFEASDSVCKFKELGYPQWTLRHGFYANMGGIVIIAPDCKAFPITARRVHYLVAQKLMPFPDISMEEVWDKSKADLLTKLLVCSQILWLVIQVLARLIQHIQVTTLELITLSYVLCTCATYIMWLHKPLDVERPTRITLNVSIRSVLVQAGPVAAEPYKQNPLDLVDNQAPCWWINAQKYLGFRVEPRERPLPRFTNDKFPNVGLGFETLFYFVIAHAFTGIHLAGWNLEAFPTAIERDLWRAASLVMAGCIVACWFLEGTQEQFRQGRVMRWQRWLSSIAKNNRSDSSATEHSVPPLTVPSREEAMAHPNFIPLWEFLLFVPVSLTYSIARLYIMAEVFAGLRSLPEGAFETVDWTNLILHV
ncbi:hypothetical protein MMC17_001225 [Xylographa soralifera]|nr:hypothetical protein [Xylographa soralifera]